MTPGKYFWRPERTLCDVVAPDHPLLRGLLPAAPGELRAKMPIGGLNEDIGAPTPGIVPLIVATGAGNRFTGVPGRAYSDVDLDTTARRSTRSTSHNSAAAASWPASGAACRLPWIKPPTGDSSCAAVGGGTRRRIEGRTHPRAGTFARRACSRTGAPSPPSRPRKSHLPTVADEFAPSAHVI